MVSLTQVGLKNVYSLDRVHAFNASTQVFDLVGSREKFEIKFNNNLY